MTAPSLASTSVKRVVAFFLVAYALSWLAWAPLVARTWGWIPHASQYLHLLGGLGPALAAFWFASREGARATLVRLIVTAPPRWLLFAVGAPTLVFGLAAAALLVAGVDVDLSATGRSLEYPELGLVAYIIANVIAYGFGEEIGWRGYALPRLTRRWGSTRATLFVAVGWAAWHLPLFIFSSGMSAMGPLEIVGWFASIVSGAFLMTFLYEASGSILATAIFHATLDVLIGSPTGGPLQSTMGAIVTVAGFVVPGLWARRSRSRVA